MNLNEKYIEDMFQGMSSRDNELPLQELSLNLTVSNRSNRELKKNTHKIDILEENQEINIFLIAEKQVGKFNQWLTESQNKVEQNLSSIQQLMNELETNTVKTVTEEDLQLIKGQLFQKQNEKRNSGYCEECLRLRQKIKNLEEDINFHKKRVDQGEKKLEGIVSEKQIQNLKEEMIGKVQVNLLNEEIDQLQSDVTILRNQKSSLQKTFFFNKTKNSELQKSKGLSAAKNSTNSSELMNRNETIAFIDPVESDVEEWIKFFETQKNRYMSICKKEESDRMKQLGRRFTKEQKQQLHKSGRLFIIFSSIKEVWNHLVTIKEHTNNFLSSQVGKNFLKEKLNYHGQIQYGSTMKDEKQRMEVRLNKLIRLNDYLICEKQNMEEINEGLKAERIKQNAVKNRLEEELSTALAKINVLIAKIKAYQNQNKPLVQSKSGNFGEPKRQKKLEGRNSNGVRATRSISHKVQLN